MPILVLLLLAAAIRLIALGGHDFWFDEALEIARERLPWPRILLLARGPDPPLFRLLQSPLATRTSSELVLRLPSVAYSVATIWLVWCWLVRLGDRRLALVTAGLLAIAPVQVFYAQEVSQYALAGLVGAGVLLAMQRALDRGDARDWLVLGALFAIAVGTYYGLVFLLAAVDVVLLREVWRRRERRQWLGFIAANGALLAIVALLYWLMLAQQYDEFASGHLRRLLGEQSPVEVLGTLLDKLEDDVLRFFWIPWSERAPRILLLLPLALASIGIASLVTRGGRWATPVVVAGASLAAMGLAHLLGLYPFGFRYAFFLSPLLFLFVAAGLCRLARSRLVALTLGTAAVLTLIAFLPNLRLVPNPWLAPPYENLAHALAWVQGRAAGDEAVYIYYGALPAFRLYQDGLSLPVIRGANVRRLPADAKVAAVASALRGARRFFVVGSHVWGDEKDVIVRGLLAPGSGYRLVESHDEVGAFAVLIAADDGS